MNWLAVGSSRASTTSSRACPSFSQPTAHSSRARIRSQSAKSHIRIGLTRPSSWPSPQVPYPTQHLQILRYIPHGQVLQACPAQDLYRLAGYTVVFASVALDTELEG